jgi:U4/U6 small nuclear ribonucleoprotein PRP31
MTTYADELLADLMSDGSGASDSEAPSDEEAAFEAGISVKPMEVDERNQDEDEDEDDDEAEMSEEGMRLVAAGGGSAVANAEDEDEARAMVAKMKHMGGINDIRSVSGLMKSLKPVLEVRGQLMRRLMRFRINLGNSADFALQKIDHYKNLPPEQQARNIGSIEDNPEYKLLIEANKLSTQIDNETILVHKFIQDHYSVRFPELASLILNPLLYAKTVAIIGNGPLENMEEVVLRQDSVIGSNLKQLLDGPTLMVVRLEATKTRGVSMPETEVQVVRTACELSVQLEKAKKIIVDYVQSRMHIFAPNLTVLVGSETAAQMVNAVGGITALAKVPASNIAAMGVKRQTFGLAKNTSIRRQGFLYFSPLVQNMPPDLRVQAMRIVGAKLVLAARIDMGHHAADGSEGERLREEAEKRLDKLTQPPPNSKGARALPVPDDKPSRKRGGRRVRKAKEQYAMTDLRQAQNRMAFGKEEEEVGVGDETRGLGMIGQKDDGRIRAAQIDQRTRAKLSKKNQGWGLGTQSSSGGSGLASSLKGFGSGTGTVLGPGLRSSGVGAGGGAGTGTASVIAFTPFQGLELVNPKAREEMDRKRKADEAGWFSSGTFTQIGGAPAPKPKIDNAGFKVPALPAIKRVKKG